LLKKDEELKVTANVKQKKQRNRKRPRSSANDKIGIILDLISSEIFTLKRNVSGPSSPHVSTELENNSAALVDADKDSQQPVEMTQLSCKNCANAADKLEQYQLAIMEIDALTRSALGHFRAADLGGKPRYDWARPMAINLANDHYRKHGRFPTMRFLHEEFCIALFRENPQLYIDKAGQGISQSDLEQLRRTPHWIQWRDRKKKPVSEKWVSDLLTYLKGRFSWDGSLYEPSRQDS